jgi:hypothetical protein
MMGSPDEPGMIPRAMDQVRALCNQPADLPLSKLLGVVQGNACFTRVQQLRAWQLWPGASDS